MSDALTETAPPVPAVAAAPATDGDPPLRIAGLGTAYGKRTIHTDLSLEVRAGEIFGLIGLNGAGKTTLIKAVLDLIPTRAGEVRLFGRPHREPDARRGLAYLPEQFLPPTTLTGWEFLSLSLGWFGLPLDRAEAVRLASDLGLPPDVLGRRVTSYSKGMGQKAGLLAAFLAARPLLILDEPMSGLDPRARIQLKTAMVRRRAAGGTLFLSSHILSDLDELCDRVAVLHEGRLLFVGTPGDLRARAPEAGSLERAFLTLVDGSASVAP